MAKTKVLVSIEDDLLAALDKIAEGLEVSRSWAVEACIESSIDDWKVLSFAGLTPRRIAKFANWLKSLKQTKFGSVVLDVRKGAKVAGELLNEGAGHGD